MVDGSPDGRGLPSRHGTDDDAEADHTPSARGGRVDRRRVLERRSRRTARYLGPDGEGPLRRTSPEAGREPAAADPGRVPHAHRRRPAAPPTGRAPETSPLTGLRP